MSSGEDKSPDGGNEKALGQKDQFNRVSRRGKNRPKDFNHAEKMLMEKTESALNKVIGDVMQEITQRMEQRLKMMPPAMASMLATRNRDNMPVIDYLTIGCHRKGALDKFLVDAKNFVGVPKAYVRKLQEI